ncbi:MAG: hypothetical protein LBV37_03020 [Mycoplasmataceae bacterium]|jgi:multisubunit Na+/H+ antiporter MnhC subunit|nr:hypothetical protein [Mycoplasmataceae bacterium]
MGFISNHDRNKEIKKLVKGNAGTKWILFITLLSAIVLAFFLFLVLGSSFNWFHTSMLDSFKITSKDAEDNVIIEWPGYILIVLTFIVLFFGVISIILVLRMRSNRNVASRAVQLSRTAIPGKRNKGSAAATIKDRVTAQ